MTGDGLLHFARLIAAGLADFAPQKSSRFYHRITISEKGKLLVEAWQQGDRTKLSQVLGGSMTEDNSTGADPGR